tara:strand:- start:498 stop:869 length:372 start_codon:yes stop_codon:yes gene_type:complete
MSNIPKVIKIKDPKTFQLVSKLAEEDNDNMNMPTHAVVKGDDIVGGWNLCEVPMVLLWHHSKKVGAKDSLILNQIQESMLSEKGVDQAFIACNSHSPYQKHMEHFGFKPVWPTNIFYKNLPKI